MSKTVKAVKPETKELSFALYKEGKTIFEIAEARGFAITTIEGHLAHYVSLGMIPVSQFVAKEKFDVIMEASKKIEVENKLTANNMAKDKIVNSIELVKQGINNNLK